MWPFKLILWKAKGIWSNKPVMSVSIPVKRAIMKQLSEAVNPMAGQDGEGVDTLEGGAEQGVIDLIWTLLYFLIFSEWLYSSIEHPS